MKTSFDRQDNLFIFGPIVVALFLLLLIYLFNWNRDVFLAINASSNYTLNLWAYITILGDGMVIAVLLIPFVRRYPKIVWAMLWTAIVFNIIVQSLKSGLNLPRPPFVLPEDSFIIMGPGHHHRSFPSGHTAAAFAYAGVVALAFKSQWKRIALFGVALLVGLSRIGVGVHWPTDVLGGLIAGWGGAWLGWWISRNLSFGKGRVFQMIIGALLLITAFVFVIDYDTHYPMSNWLQYGLGVSMIVWGIVDYIKLIKDRWV